MSNSFCSWSRSVRNSAIIRWNASSSIASWALLKTRIFTWVEKRRNSTIDRKWEVNYLKNGQLSTSHCIKTVIIFQQQFVFNIEINGSVQLFQKIGNMIRSSDDSKWQACMRETDVDRSWHKQATGNREPAKFLFRWDEQGRSNARQSWLVTALHSWSRGPGGACARTLLCKWELRFGRWCLKSGETKTEAQYSYSLKKKNERDPFCEQKSMATGKQQSTKSSTKDVNLGTITDTLSWHQFSPLSGYNLIRVKPKLHRRRRRIYESFRNRRKSQKVIYRDNSSEFGKSCEELTWNHWTATPPGYLRDVQDLLANGKSQNERRFGESF